MLETLAETRKEHRTLFDLSEYPLTDQVLRNQEAVQVMIGDPETDPRRSTTCSSSATARC